MCSVRRAARPGQCVRLTDGKAAFSPSFKKSPYTIPPLEGSKPEQIPRRNTTQIPNDIKPPNTEYPGNTARPPLRLAATKRLTQLHKCARHQDMQQQARRFHLRMPTRHASGSKVLISTLRTHVYFSNAFPCMTDPHT